MENSQINSKEKNPTTSFTLANQEIIYDPTQKAEELAKNFHAVHNQTAINFTP